MAAPLLPLLRDLQAELSALGRGQVLVLLGSRSDCRFCLEVRRNYLAPLQRDGAPRLRVRELEADVPGDLTDADGARRSPEEVLRRLRIRFYPTVVFLGSGGRVLAEPLVGLDQAGFYGAYLDGRIQQALAAA